MNVSAGHNTAADEAAIRERVQNWARAVRAKDIDGSSRITPLTC
jgi:ketosteroid isomerase-like protein